VFHIENVSNGQNQFQCQGEISDLCEISDLLLFVSNFASQSKGIKFVDNFLMCFM